MSKKQLSTLFFIALVAFTGGNGMAPLLPVYATQLGATPAVAGYYMASMYIGLAAGNVAGGWLSDRLGRRKLLLISAGAAGIPAIWLMGQATNIWQLAAATAIGWFFIALGGAQIGILTGLFAEETERGKIFGILALAAPLGSLLGGATVGPIADRWGYPTMFTAVALFSCLWPLAGLLLEDKGVAQDRLDEAASPKPRPRFSRSFFLLLLVSILAGVVVFVGNMGRSLAMDELGFSAGAISSTEAVGGAVMLPLLPLIGWLSDRVGRKRFMILCYLAGAAGLLVLAASVSIWHFWIAASLLAFLFNINRGIGFAVVTDLVSQASLGRGMSLFLATPWVGGIIGYAAAGRAVESLGLTPTLVLGAFLPLLAILFLIPIREARRKATAVGVAPAEAG
jgi:AAHS family 3-hydroxyphenylpropionic acid transporter